MWRLPCTLTQSVRVTSFPTFRKRCGLDESKSEHIGPNRVA